MKLNPKQQRFVDEYLIDLNATQAAIRAGYSAKHADVQGPRLLGNAGVAAAIQTGRARLTRKLEVTQERVLQELARIAFADMRDLFTWDEERACYIPSANLTDDQAAAVSAVEAETLRTTAPDGTVDTKIRLKLKTYDKKGALDSLAKHLGMFVERHEHTGRDGGPIETHELSDTELLERAKQHGNRITALTHTNGNGNGRKNGNGSHP